MIDRKQAGNLFIYDYKLIDKSGKMYQIKSVHPTMLSIARVNYTSYITILYEDIGSKFFVVARDLSELKEEVYPGIVPLIECAKIAYPNERWVMYENSKDKFAQ